MGMLKKLNQWRKKDAEPESEKLIRELAKFYEEHPTSTPAVAREVQRIRDEHTTICEKIQKDFDGQYEETRVVYLRRELNFISGFVQKPNK